MKLKLVALAAASVAALSTLTAQPAAADDGWLASTSGRSAASYKDKGDWLTVCDRHPGDGRAATARMVIVHPDGSLTYKRWWSVYDGGDGGCITVGQEVKADGSPYYLVVCDWMFGASDPTRFNCNKKKFNG